MSATQDKRIEDVLLSCGELMGCAGDVDSLVMVLAGILTTMGFVVVPVELLRDVLPEFIRAAKKRGITMPTMGGESN